MSKAELVIGPATSGNHGEEAAGRCAWLGRSKTMRYSRSIGTALLGLGLEACAPDVVVGDLGNYEASAPTTRGGSSGGHTAPVGVGGGGVASSGSSSIGGSGPSSDECATDLKHIIEVPALDCPATVPELGDACDMAEGALCTWQTGLLDPQAAGFQVFACYQHAGERSWFGTQYADGRTGGLHNELCPHTPVAAGASCEGHENQLCKYLSETCLCDATTNWTCQPGIGNLVTNQWDYVLPLCFPFDETQLVKDLTPSEARAWCTWSIDPLGYGADLSLLAPASPPYNLEGLPTFYGDVALDVCLPQMPVDACVANLGEAPDCDATLGEFDACIETIRGQVRVAQGCEPLLANPNCTGVLVTRVGDGSCPRPGP